MPAERGPPSIGLIAGNGAMPLLVARAARARGLAVHAVGHIGETDAALHDAVDSLSWVRVGQVGRIVRTLRQLGVAEAMMAGGIDKRRLFARARPDWLGLRLLGQLAVRRDDDVLRAVAAAFEARGVRIVASTLHLPDAMAPEGVLGCRRPTGAQWQDLREGLRVARAIGTLDIGQTVVLRAGAVVALEAIEGTDACIARAGVLTGGRGAVVVKAAKPGQDMRFDVPTVGPRTIAALAAAGAAVLGLEAGRTLLLEPQATLRAADAAGIAVVGLPCAEGGGRGTSDATDATDGAVPSADAHAA